MLPLLGLATFLIAGLTVLSGFGVGTLLTPLLALFYPVKTAIVSVAVVHIANNLFKLALFRRKVSRRVFLRFGLLSIAGSAVGALLLLGAAATVVQGALGVLLVAMGLAELPRDLNLRLPPWPGVDLALGFFSGFLGGLVGNQGAVRAAYLLGARLEQEVFVATAAAISVAVDLTRLPIYLASREMWRLDPWSLALLIACAFTGTWLGRGLLLRVRPDVFRRVVALALIAAGAGLTAAVFSP